MKKEIADNVVPEHVMEHLARIVKGHSGWYFSDIRWIVNIMMDFAQSAYEKAFIHGAKHGYEAAMRDLADEINRLKEGKIP